MDSPSDRRRRRRHPSQSLSLSFSLSRVALAVLGAGALAGASCAAMTPPVKSSGGVRSPEGVTVAVARQHCEQTFEPSWTGRDLTEEILDIEIQNAASAPLAVHGDAFRLVTPEGYRLRTLTWGAATPLPVAAGETRTMRLRFMTRGSLECGREMRLDPDGGVRLAARPISIGAVRFVPRPPSS
jgi:hypothetical protein